VGGRSRVAAQMLAGKGFKHIINMAGGIKKWDQPVAVGDLEQGIELFSGDETPLDTLTTAFSLEEGLREFYLSMIEQVDNEAVRDLFQKLSDIEILHQQRILKEYNSLSGENWTVETFAPQKAAPAMEGGLTTEEYIRMFDPDLESPADVISLAMSIEAQAFDLYERASARSENGDSRGVLKRIAEEERAHMTQLGKLMAQL
jgi:rubrerythrin